jgi:hypothetical protein
MLKRALILSLALVTIAAPGCRRGDAPPTAARTEAARAEPTPILLDIPTRSNAAVSVGALGKTVAAVWTSSTEDGSADIYATISTDAGRTFGPPVRVNDVEGDARASGEQTARVVVGVGNGIHVVWPSRRDGHSIIKYATSKDFGRTFTPAVTVAGSKLGGARGWHALALGYDGGVQVVWLDGRFAPPMRHRHANPQAAAAMKAGRSAGAPRQDIFHASLDKSGTWSERPIDTNVCFCCKTAIAATGENVYAAYRDIYPGSLRDITVSRSSDNGVTFGRPIRVSEDGWKIDACPDDGPAMVADGHGGIHVAWPTLLEGDRPHKAIFYSTLTGEAFAPRVRLDSGDGDPAHPQMASDFHTNTAVVWDERYGATRRVVFRPVSDGKAGPAQAFAGDGVSYPVVASTEGGWIVLWTSQDSAGRSIVEGRRIPVGDSGQFTSAPTR